jgi:hypothetical protein
MGLRVRRFPFLAVRFVWWIFP